MSAPPWPRNSGLSTWLPTPTPVASQATALGDITEQMEAASLAGDLNGVSDLIDYYGFTLTEAREVAITLTDQETDGDLYLEDGEGAVLSSAESGGSAEETVAHTLTAGAYFLRVEAAETGANGYTLAYRTASPVPNAPPAIIAIPSHDRVWLDWLAPLDDSITGYQILRGDDQHSLSQIGETSGRLKTDYGDEDVEAATPYVYAVHSVNEHGVSEAITLHIATEAAPVVLGTAEQTQLQSVSEPVGQDFPTDDATTGRVVVGETVTGEVNPDK